MLQRLRCLLREPKDKQYKAKRRRSLTETVQRLLKFYARLQETHRPDRQKQHSNLGQSNRKQHSNLGQSNSLPIMCILPLQRGLIMYFGLVGSQNQLCTFYTLKNVLVTNLFYIHARHRTIELATGAKNGVLQSVPWSVGRSRSDVTSASRGSPNQPIRRNQKHRIVFLNICSQAENCDTSRRWRSVFDLSLIHI